MILLNGIPPVIGVGLLHVTVINVLAITFEYYYLKKKLNQDRLLLRTILANLISLAAGILVMFTLSDLLPGNISKLGMEYSSMEDRMAMIPSLAGLILANICLEIPAFLIRQDAEILKVTKHVIIANLITNIPIVILYGMLAV
ncbi:MAG: hypothetical protein AAFQ98_01545 [Bacteroidota bacterium]